MPSINVYGSGRGGGPQGPTPEQIKAQQIDQAWAQRNQQQRAQDPRQRDFERARRQADREAVAQDRADRQKTRQEAADFRRADAERLRIERQSNALARREIQERERQLRYEQQRFNAAQRLGVGLSTLDSRAAGPLTPNSWMAVQRQAANLAMRQRQFGNQFGFANAPFGTQAIRGTLNQAGSFVNTYRTANIARMGGIGQRAADERSWTQLYQINQELRRLEGINQRILNSETATVGQRRDATRALDAIAGARQRIAVGREGNSPLMNALGTGMGFLGAMRAGPVGMAVEGALAAAGTAYEMPHILSGIHGKFMQGAAPYMDLRLRSAALGRAGGFNSQDLMGQLYQNGTLQQWQAQYGITAPDALRLLEQYGNSTPSANRATDIVKQIGSAHLAPFMGLSREELAVGLGGARTLGVATDQAVSSDKYFAEMQKVMTKATTAGLDHSQVLRTVTGLMFQTASAGAVSIDQGGLGKFWSRAVSSGLPMARSGEGIAAALGNMQQAWGNIGPGGNPAQNIALQSYLSAHGGMPKNAEAFKKTFKLTDEQYSKIASTPGGQQMLQDYFEAAKTGSPLAYEYLQPMMAGNPDLMQAVSSEFASKFPKSAQPAVFANTLGTNYSQSLMFRGGGNGDVSQDMINAAARVTGLPASWIASVQRHEGSWKNGKWQTSSAGAVGGMQLLPGTFAEMKKKYNIQGDINDPMANTLAGSYYLREQWDRFHDVRKATSAYNAGPGNIGGADQKYVNAIMADLQGQTISPGAMMNNVPSDIYKYQATQGQLEMQAGQNSFNALGGISDNLGNTFIKLSSEVTGATGALKEFANTIRGIITHPSSMLPKAGVDLQQGVNSVM